MQVRLPLLDKSGQKILMVEVDRVPCSQQCLYLDSARFEALLEGGLGRSNSGENFLILTRDKTIIKKRLFTQPHHWHELGYDYTIDPAAQSRFLKSLQEQPVTGLATVKGVCNCSTEVMFIEGELATGVANPLTRYYKRTFATKAHWTYPELVAFAESALKTIAGLHERGIVHGDLTGHNFMLDANNQVWLVDLDTIGGATEATVVQDYLALVSYALLPITGSFMSEGEARSFLANLLQGLFAGSVDPDHLLILLNQARSATPGHVPTFFAALISSLNKSLLNYTYEYERATQALGQSHTLLAETHRLWTKKLQAQEQLTQEQVASIKSVLQAREEELASVKSVLQAREEELASVKSVLQAREEELASIKVALQASQAEIIRLSETLQTIQGSKTYRLSQHLQQISRVVRPKTSNSGQS